jgi:AraC family transcriptional activator of pobA
MEKIPVRRISLTEKDTAFSETFRIRALEDLLSGRDMIHPLHRHDFFYILVLEKGRGSHEIDFVSYDICDNVVFFLRPGQVHRLKLETGSTGYLMQFKADIFQDAGRLSGKSESLLRTAGRVNRYHFETQLFEKISFVLSYIFQEYADHQEGFREVIKANLHIFLIELTRMQASVPAGSVLPYVQERLEEFLELLEVHYVSYKKVSFYAEMMHLSTYQLNAITRTTLGKTCSEVISEHNLLESKRYLLATTGQVNQIAFQLGYEDVSYFIRFFRKHSGYSPEAFRQKFKEVL